MEFLNFDHSVYRNTFLTTEYNNISWALEIDPVWIQAPNPTITVLGYSSIGGPPPHITLTFTFRNYRPYIPINSVSSALSAGLEFEVYIQHLPDQPQPIKVQHTFIRSFWSPHTSYWDTVYQAIYQFVTETYFENYS